MIYYQLPAEEGMLPEWRLPTACDMSFFLIVEFQKFFTSLSVLPGRCLAIWAHLQRSKAQRTAHILVLAQSVAICVPFIPFLEQVNVILHYARRV